MIKGPDDISAEKRVYDNLPDFIKHPLKQLKSGIPVDDIQCNDSLILLQKYDGSPACVTESTKIELIKRGWVNVQFYQDYIGIEEISGGNITHIAIEHEDKTILLQLEADSDGYVIVTIPRIVLEAIMSDEKDSEFFVLINGQEVNFDDTATDTTRTVKIDFNNESEKIETILPELI